jgi:hypothetical protein
VGNGSPVLDRPATRTFAKHGGANLGKGRRQSSLKTRVGPQNSPIRTGAAARALAPGRHETGSDHAHRPPNHRGTRPRLLNSGLGICARGDRRHVARGLCADPVRLAGNEHGSFPARCRGLLRWAGLADPRSANRQRRGLQEQGLCCCRPRTRLKHRFTRFYRPQTNGKAARCIQTDLREWAYARAYTQSQQRAQELPRWLHRYNWHRPHSSLAGQPPITRLALSWDNLLRLHS